MATTGIVPKLKWQSKQKLNDKYATDYMVGMGTFGYVYKGTAKDKTKNVVAIKRFKDGQAISFTACREIALLRELDHEHIVRLVDVCVEPLSQSLYLIFDYAEYDLYVCEPLLHL